MVEAFPGGTASDPPPSHLIPSITEMPLLIVTSNELKLSQRFLIREDRFTIGRTNSSAVPIQDKSVSKVHVAIARTPQGYFFQDLLSRNGTFLNEKRCDSGCLQHGDVLRLGRIRVTFLEEEPVEPEKEGAPEEKAYRSKGPPPREQATAVNSPTPSISELFRKDLELLHLSRRRKRIIAAALCIGALGIGLGFLAGHIDLFSRGGSEKTSAESSRIASGDDIPPIPQEEIEVRLMVPNRLEPEEKIPGENAQENEIQRIAKDFAEGLNRVYESDEESMRVLFRLFLDILERSPTRSEVQEIIPLNHGERWQRIQALSTPSRSSSMSEEASSLQEESGNSTGGISGAFQRFLGRRPTQLERRALAELMEKDFPPRGNLEKPEGESSYFGRFLTASAEYWRPTFRRKKTIHQQACSLIVDLLDRTPSSLEEVREVEDALLERNREAGVARILAHSKEATRSLPDFSGNGTSPEMEGGRKSENKQDLLAWVRSEFFRFLLRFPSEGELGKLVEELDGNPESSRWFRLALSLLPEYRSY